MKDIAEDLNVAANIAGTSTNTAANKNQGEPGVDLKKKKSPIIDPIFSRNPFSDFYNKMKSESITEAKQKPINNDQVSNSVASELFARCRSLATITHFAHLSTDSYSEHQALATFYSDIVDKVDAFAESYIGKYGKFISLPNIPSNPQVAVDAILQSRDWIDSNRNLITDDTSLQNLIDEIVELINITVYKLQKLK